MIGFLASLLIAIAALWLAYQLWAYLRRRSVLRITPEQLRARIERGDPVSVIDLRKWEEVLNSGEKLPGAFVRTAVELMRDRAAGTLRGDLILYCS